MVFGSLASDGTFHDKAVYNANEQALHFAIGIGVLAFIVGIIILILFVVDQVCERGLESDPGSCRKVGQIDTYKTRLTPQLQMSSAMVTQRRLLVLVDLALSVLLTILWLVGKTSLFFL